MTNMIKRLSEQSSISSNIQSKSLTEQNVPQNSVSSHFLRKNTDLTSSAFRNIKELDDSTVSIKSLKKIKCQNFISLVTNPHVYI